MVAPQGLRILFLTPQIPYPPHQGTTIRNFNLLSRLARRHVVDLLSFAASPERDDLGPLEQMCDRVRLVPATRRSMGDRFWSLVSSSMPDMALRLRSAAFERALQEIVESRAYDVIQIEGIEMGQYALWLRRWLQSGQGEERHVRLVFEDHNAEYVLQRRAYEADRCQIGRWAAALYSWIQWRRLRRYEATVCGSADAVVAVSEADAAALESLRAGTGVVVVPNGVDLQVYDPANVVGHSLGPKVVLFTGKMDFRPNVDGILWFCDEVWPLVRESVPDVRFFVVGKDPHPRLRRLYDLPGVTVTGWVEDTLPYFVAAQVYVVPLRVGGGTRLKVLEAMAMGLPIVSTRLGAEGLGLESERQLKLASTPAAFSEAVVSLLEDEPAGRELGASAQRFARESFGWQAIVPRLEELYASLA